MRERSRICPPGDPCCQKTGKTLNWTDTVCSGVPAAPVRRRHLHNEEMRRWPGEATPRIALTLPLGPVIVFQLIAAGLRRRHWQMASSLSGVRRGARQIVLTGGEKWILGPNDTRPRAEALRHVSKCWSIQSAGKQEIRWRCLRRSRGYYIGASGESFAWWRDVI